MRSHRESHLQSSSSCERSASSTVRRGEVDRSQHIPVSFEKRAPGCLSFAVRCRFDTVLLENVAHSRVGDVVADVGQRTLNAIVAPGGILFGELHDQVDDCLPHSRSANRVTAAVAAGRRRAEFASYRVSL